MVKGKHITVTLTPRAHSFCDACVTDSDIKMDRKDPARLPPAGGAPSGGGGIHRTSVIAPTAPKSSANQPRASVIAGGGTASSSHHQPRQSVIATAGSTAAAAGGVAKRTSVIVTPQPTPSATATTVQPPPTIIESPPPTTNTVPPQQQAPPPVAVATAAAATNPTAPKPLVSSRAAREKERLQNEADALTAALTAASAAPLSDRPVSAAGGANGGAAGTGRSAAPAVSARNELASAGGNGNTNTSGSGGGGGGGFRSAQPVRISLDHLLAFCFPSQQLHSRSTARLYAMTDFGPPLSRHSIAAQCLCSTCVVECKNRRSTDAFARAIYNGACFTPDHFHRPPSAAELAPHLLLSKAARNQRRHNSLTGLISPAALQPLPTGSSPVRPATAAATLTTSTASPFRVATATAPQTGAGGLTASPSATSIGGASNSTAAAGAAGNSSKSQSRSAKAKAKAAADAAPPPPVAPPAPSPAETALAASIHALNQLALNTDFGSLTRAMNASTAAATATDTATAPSVSAQPTAAYPLSDWLCKNCQRHLSTAVHLVSGEMNQHLVSDLELDEMARQIDRADILNAYDRLNRLTLAEQHQFVSNILSTGAHTNNPTKHVNSSAAKLTGTSTNIHSSLRALQDLTKAQVTNLVKPLITRSSTGGSLDFYAVKSVVDAHRRSRIADLKKMYTDLVMTKGAGGGGGGGGASDPSNDALATPIKPLLTAAFRGAKKIPDHLAFHVGQRFIHANVHQIGEYSDKNRPEIRTNSYLIRSLEPNAQTNWRA